MSKKDIILLTCRDRFFGQTRKPWTGLDVAVLVEELGKRNYDCQIYDFHEIVNAKEAIKDKIILYAFSQKQNYREYINDIVFHLSKNNEVVPGFDLLKCHENKGWQEIFKKEIGLESLKAQYYSSIKEIDLGLLQYPLVLKTIRGSNGKGVFLINNLDELKKVSQKLTRVRPIKKRFQFFRKRFFQNKKFPAYPNYTNRQDYLDYKDYYTKEELFVLQQYVPDLDFDYRILVTYNHYYVMKREIKEGDFRASGTKLFCFTDKPDISLLNYAEAVYKKFDTPFLSMDIMFNGQEYFLGEFQALHFGVSAIVKSNGYFDKQNDQWRFTNEKPKKVEEVFARTYASYLDNIMNR